MLLMLVCQDEIQLESAQEYRSISCLRTARQTDNLPHREIVINLQFLSLSLSFTSDTSQQPLQCQAAQRNSKRLRSDQTSLEISM